jgi:hypothetical protein
MAEKFEKLIYKNLYPGLEVKNYKALCELLELNPQGGNTKKANLENLERYCEIERVGHKFIIKDFRDEVLEKTDKRSVGNNNKYAKIIETILLCYFKKYGKNNYQFTKNELWLELGMVNKNFTENYNNKSFKNVVEKEINEQQSEENSHYLTIKQWHVDRAYINSITKLNNILRTAFDSLIKKHVIELNFVIIGKDSDDNLNPITENDEVEAVLDCENKALEALKCETLKEVFKKSSKTVNIQKYFELRNNYLYERLGLKYIYRVYDITCSREYVEKKLERNIRELRKEINSNILDYLEHQAELDYKKAKEKRETGKTEVRYPLHYVDIQNFILEKIIKLDENEKKTFLKIKKVADAIEVGIDEDMAFLSKQ